MDIASIIDLLRFPIETVGIILLWQIHQRQRVVASRVGHIEKKLGISYPEGMLA